MTVATWLPSHAYTAGNLVNPITSNGHTFICTATGTSAASEPAWSGRYPAITDGTAAWAPYTVVSPATLRSQLNLESTTGQYSTDIIGNYILDAISSLEQTTRRFLVNHPDVSWGMTSYGRPILPLPGFRSVSSVTWQGSIQTASTSAVSGDGYNLLPDAMQTGVYTGISFRPLHTSAGPWWLSLGGATTNWFDTGADNPFDPRNYGGGYVFTSVAQDTLIVGTGGWEPLFEPGDFTHALEVLAAWYVMRPAAILADSAITPAGGVVSYSQMPPEVQNFCKKWSAGQMAVSVG